MSEQRISYTSAVEIPVGLEVEKDDDVVGIVTEVKEDSKGYHVTIEITNPIMDVHSILESSSLTSSRNGEG